jgi:cytochrome c553
VNADYLHVGMHAVVFAGLAAVLLAAAPLGARADTLDTTGQPPYERCGYCHELDGNSRMDTFPRIAGQHYDYLVKQLRDFRAGRRKGAMTATAELLSDAEIVEVARYFNAQPLRAAANVTMAASQQFVAERLHRGGDPARGIPACGSCHGVNGEGRRGTPRLAGQHKEYLKTQLLGFKHKRRDNDEGAVMRTVAAAVTEDEIQALAHYFAAKQPARETASTKQP